MRIRKPLRLTLAILAATAAIGGIVQPVAAQVAPASASTLQLNTGRGRLVTLDTPMSDVFVANEGIADVQVRSPTQLYIFGKAPGETTVSVTNKAGRVIYSTTVRVGNNIDSIDAMLRLAMPEAEIVATPMNGLVLLTGTVASPGDAAEAERLVQAFVGDNVKIVSRLRTATPLQVMVQVRFAEVSRTFLKNVGVNLLTRDQGSGISFGVGSGTRTPGTIGTPDLSNLPVLDASSKFGFPAGTISLPFDPARGDFVYPGTGTTNTFTKNPATFTSLGIAGRLLGLDVLSAIDLGERIGQVTTLATPNLTALSGETATFLAGGEIPIPISQGLGAVSVEYKQYGVSLAFTPTVMSDGRISLRVRPEVSQLSAAGAVQIGGTTIPALTTRRTETSIELGSGESMMIAGLVSNSHDNNIDKAPGLGDVPVLGALFRSNAFQRNETELVIVITPYLVKPVNANEIVLPTDGYRAPNDFDRILGGQLGGSTKEDRPKPRMETAPDNAPSVGSLGTPAMPMQGAAPQLATAPAPAPRREERRPQPNKKSKAVASAAPGFGQ
ncbi:type II and III secretion system protein family protein [Sphingomonas sp. G-3-2-10]|jgi:pilus assembly protein CpaC|uniref:type II and III secretion system protein family protein n=1 Tax=Sphingomonas sp. G-3-2-10 TaxID=2728838 RepID=UPI00146F63A3|nr:type II and III secretion system protein family protein [Sphingomonas sp. G-3-2-10]NML06063.1 type II and III secretion system protein family protein [Sphingomonas sp. G-3-2-10]